jgi:N,N-dimethylformamidase beta subunit-like protein
VAGFATTVPGPLPVTQPVLSEPLEPSTETPAEESLVAGPAVSWRGTAPWQIRISSSASRLTEAYADSPSYLPGQTLRLAVSTTAPSYTVSIWRLGGSISRMYASSNLAGTRQTATMLDSDTALIRANWTYGFELSLPVTWRSGIYLARIAGLNGAQSYVKFVIRSGTPSSLLFVANALTDAAYNRWGGASLYQTSIGRPASGVGHAIQVSLDRPNLLENGAGLMFVNELPLAAWLERQGYEVAYTTDWDLSRQPADQAVPRAVIFAGHSEYWGTALRSWLDDLVLDRGQMSLGLFASNSGYWPVDISEDGRTITCYKEALTKPGFAGATGSQDRPVTTLRFRELPLGDPHPENWPEQTLFGVQYGSLSTAYAPYVLGPNVPPELLTGTGLAPGSSIGTLAGGETDSVDARYVIPPGQVIVAEASGFSDRYGGAANATAVIRRTAWGSRVFAAGTAWWGWGTDPAFARAHRVPAAFGQFSRNIVNALIGR